MKKLFCEISFFAMSCQSLINAIFNQFNWLTLLMISSASVVAQDHYIIEGQVVDASTNKPVPFATLSIADGLLSNETNSEGYFMLNIPKQAKFDTLRLVALHYQLTQIPLISLPSTKAIIRLDARPHQMHVSTTDTYFSFEQPFQTRDTLLKAVAAIAKNYTHKPTLLHEFYREIIQEQPTNLCVSYTEGLMDVYKPSYYFPGKDDQIHFIKGRRKPLSSFSIPVLSPGPWSSNMLDVVKYQEFLFHNGKLNKEYIFALAGRTVVGGQPVYIITFNPRSSKEATGYYKGKLFLLLGSLAIIGAEYELTDQGLSLLNKSRYAQVYATQLSQRVYRVTYSQFGDQWSFQSGSVENSFRQMASGLSFRSRIDLVVTHRQVEDAKPFLTRELADYRTMRLDSFDKTNSTYWAGETYLAPPHPLPPLLIEAEANRP
ncbi:peptidase associated/transthyretin-like domain-containing protein [Spirosoma flavum]|uniref:Carboxypeptidase-like regulatory domain-containing protein n=1 Tax=Spirosoma flavum TaxID=2048557 RepID=A0ABW6AKL2_9BACT